MAVCGEIRPEHLNNCGKIRSFDVKTGGAYDNHWASGRKYEFERNHLVCQNSVSAGVDCVLLQAVANAVINFRISTRGGKFLE